MFEGQKSIQKKAYISRPNLLQSKQLNKLLTMYTKTLAVLNFAFYNGIYAIDVASGAIQIQEEILSQVDIQGCDGNYMGTYSG